MRPLVPTNCTLLAAITVPAIPVEWMSESFEFYETLRKKFFLFHMGVLPRFFECIVEAFYSSLNKYPVSTIKSIHPMRQ